MNSSRLYSKIVKTRVFLYNLFLYFLYLHLQIYEKHRNRKCTLTDLYYMVSSDTCIYLPVTNIRTGPFPLSFGLLNSLVMSGKFT